MLLTRLIFSIHQNSLSFFKIEQSLLILKYPKILLVIDFIVYEACVKDRVKHKSVKPKSNFHSSLTEFVAAPDEFSDSSDKEPLAKL